MKQFILAIVVFWCALASAQEICNNGLDDDNDDLIDLNDHEDCTCEGQITDNYIANPSFEDYDCCPAELSLVNECLSGWIQPSRGTSDFYHNCDSDQFTAVFVKPDLPYPDGDGIVGFWNNDPSKEYVSSCLNNTLESGVEYEISFYVSANDNFEDINISIFGKTDCSDLTFGGDPGIECPEGVDGWGFLGELEWKLAGPRGEWEQVSITFTPTFAVNGFMIGATCGVPPNGTGYYFIDDLVLTRTDGISGTITPSGSICSGDLRLTASSIPNATYQWYFNGEALVDEDDVTFNYNANVHSPGMYQVTIIVSGGCELVEYEVEAEDCGCDSTLTIGGPVGALIPNPSFEDTLCCPVFEDNGFKMSCAESWFQGTNTSSDFHHTCNEDDFNPAPEPIPDGEGVLGFIIAEDYSEYISACLNGVMQAGETYTITFDLAHDKFSGNYPPFNFTFYGHTNCSELTIATEESCPSDHSNWVEIGSVEVDPNNIYNAWGTFTVTITPNFDVAALMLGSPCGLPANSGFQTDERSYFWIDNMLIEGGTSAEVMLDTIGSFCTNDLSVFVNGIDGAVYQWYLNDQELPGETDTIVNVSANSYGPGTYSVGINLDNQCAKLDIDVEEDCDLTVIAVADTICPGEAVNLTVTASGGDGNYTYTWDGGGLVNADGQNQTDSPITTTDYTISVTDGSGNAGDTTITVVVLENCDCDSSLVIGGPGGSLIPNPSFEDTLCCPVWDGTTGSYTLECAVSWQQATNNTSDFMHFCAEDDFPTNIPLPFPDGDGVARMIWSERTRELIGACLNEPMLAGGEYEITFQVALPINGTGGEDVPVTAFSFYGTPNCNELPIPEWNVCPPEHGNWELIGTLDIDPNAIEDNWTEVSITLNPTFDVEAIIMGPPCTLPLSGYASNRLVYIDNLQLQSTVSHNAQLDTLGSFCTNDLSVFVNGIDGAVYQWYLNDQELPGETDTIVNVSGNNYGPGTYSVGINLDNQCAKLDIEVEEDCDLTVTAVADTICPSEVVNLTVTASGGDGNYTYTWNGGGLVNANGQDQTDSPITTTDYTISVTDGSGNAGDTTITVVVLENCDCDSSLTLSDSASTFIPNPSFEDMSCCPPGVNRTACVDDWVGNWSSEYFNTCGFTAMPVGGPAMPPPDGNGYVGMLRNENVSVCLSNPMRAGINYTLGFYISVPKELAEGDLLELAIFGSGDCNSINVQQLGNKACMHEFFDWQVLESIEVAYDHGDARWQFVSMSFTPTRDIYSIALQQGCFSDSPWTYYVYADHFSLQSSGTYSPGIQLLGTPCTDDLQLYINNIPGAIYQWYLNDQELPGETDTIVNVSGNNYGPGTYSVGINLDNQCAKLDIDVEEDCDLTVIAVADTICPGEVVNLTVTASGGDGNYTYTWNGGGLVNADGQNQTDSPITTTDYTISVTDGSGNAGDTTITVVVLENCDCDSSLVIGGPGGSLIPNPSFEDTLCCPVWENGSFNVSCATSWFQGTNRTSDFHNICIERDHNPPPMPMPNGDGVMGMIIREDVREYISTCLNGVMQQGETYTVTFDLAHSTFNNTADFPPFNFTFYGHTNCSELTVNTVEPCPIDFSDWQEIGTVVVDPSTIALTWNNFTVTITPDFDVSALLIGGPCELPQNSGFQNHDRSYFWIDNLSLNSTVQHDASLDTIGSFCTNDLSVFVNGIDGAVYQWYLNDQELPGETDTIVNVSGNNYGPGTYSVGINLDNQCAKLDIEVEEDCDLTVIAVADTICPGEVVNLTVTASGGDGNYTYTWNGGGLVNANGQDQTDSPITTTDYTISVTDGSGNAGDTTITVVVLENCDCDSSLTLSDSASTFIPNPSFEDMSCCPPGVNRTACVDDWVGNWSSEYFNTCGFTAMPVGGPAMPPPDGNGYVGMLRNENVSVCLSNPMRAGINYTLGFYISVPKELAEGDLLELAIFGSGDCNSINVQQLGNKACMHEFFDWQVLESIEVAYDHGDARWQFVSMSFTPTRDIYSIALQQGCFSDSPWTYYVYADHFSLQSSGTYSPGIQLLGTPCTDDLQLYINNIPGAIYQWYLNDQELPGETDTIVNVSGNNYGPGTYSVGINLDNQCAKLDIDVEEDCDLTVIAVADTICPGEVVNLTVTASGGDGDYTYTWNGGGLVNADGQNQTDSPITTTDYTISVTDGSGNAGDTTITVVVLENCDCDSSLVIGGPGGSLIPNPSFEDTLCCPVWDGDRGAYPLECAVSWQQATNNTSDFMHQCAEDYFPTNIPLPFPDGDGVARMIWSDRTREFIGTCLDEPMLAGGEYVITFSVALPINGTGGEDIPETAFSFYGTPNCNELPIPEWRVCPPEHGNWELIGALDIDPNAIEDNWTEVTITLYPAFDVRAFMMGAPCTLPATGYDDSRYFYIDNLQLQSTVSHNAQLDTIGSFCRNDLQVFISDIPGAVYQWYLNNQELPGETDTIVGVSDNNYGPGTYSVGVNLDNQCALLDIEIPLQFCNPQVTGLGDTICIGDTATLLAWGAGGDSSSYTFDWVGDGLITSTGDTVTAVPTTSGILIYDVTVTDASNNSHDTVVILVVHELPAVTAETETTICLEDTATVRAGGAYTYIWDNGLPGDSIHQVTPTVTTTYTVTGTDTNGCVNTDSVTITVDHVEAEAGNDINICVGGQAQLTASGGDTYRWTPNDGTLSSTTIVNPIATPIDTTTYYVEVRSAIGHCVAYDSVTINTGGLVVDLGPDDTLCLGESYQFNVGVVGDYSWQSDNDTLSSTTVYNPLATPTVTSIYTVHVSDPDIAGCEDRDSITIYVEDVTAGIITAPQIICRGDELLLTATGGGTYQWTGTPSGTNITNPTSATPTVAPLIQTTYTVTVSNSSGKCSDTAELTIDVDSIVASASADFFMCLGSTSSLLNVTAPGATSYSWSPITYLDNATIANPQIVNPTVAGTISYEVSVSNANNCVDKDTVEVTIGDVIVNAEALSPRFCVGDTGQVRATTTTTGALFSWQSDGGILIGTSSQTPGFTATDTGTYILTVTATDGNGQCPDVDSTTIEVANVYADAGADTTVCKDDELTLNGAYGPSYSWSPTEQLLANADAFNPTVNTSGSGIRLFVLTVTDNSLANCEATDTVEVTVEEVTVTAQVGPDNIMEGETAILNATTNGAYVIWSKEETGELVDEGVYPQLNNITVNPTESTIYIVESINDNDCRNTASVYLQVISAIRIPNVITPNGDGENDSWVITNIEDYPDVEIKIRNRWGNLVWKKKDGYDNRWTGNSERGASLPVGTYYFEIKLNYRGLIYSGDLTILR